MLGLIGAVAHGRQDFMVQCKFELSVFHEILSAHRRHQLICTLHSTWTQMNLWNSPQMNGSRLIWHVDIFHGDILLIFCATELWITITKLETILSERLHLHVPDTGRIGTNTFSINLHNALSVYLTVTTHANEYSMRNNFNLIWNACSVIVVFTKNDYYVRITSAIQ